MNNRALTSCTFWLLLIISLAIPDLSPVSWVLTIIAFGLRSLYRNDYR